MSNRKFILIVLVCWQSSIFGQPTIGSNSNIADIPKIIPPSPNAAALEKFITIPVDYSTGIPSITYPMWSWQRGKLQFNIGLSYHAGGHKIDDMAPCTGLGWALTGIGRVSRTIRGVADDDQVKGYMHTSDLPNAITSSYDITSWYQTDPSPTNQAGISPYLSINAYNYAYANIIKDIAENKHDGEQDIFSYSINGSSGTFIIDKDKQIVPLEYTNVKIELINPSYTINGIKITDDKGIVYKFEILEYQTVYTYADTYTLSDFGVSTTGTSWLLTKIIDPNTSDSIVIKYSNAEGDGGYETNFGQNITHRLESVSGLGTVPNLATSSDVRSYALMQMDGQSVDSVLFPDGSKIKLNYDFARTDLDGTNALSTITIKNYENQIIKKYDFKYSYFSSGVGTYYPVWSSSGNDFNKRLRLDTAYEISTDGVLKKPTIFLYDTSVALNPRSSKNIDYWGYNVNPSRNNTQYVPMIKLGYDERNIAGNYQGYLEGANRNPDTVYVKAGVLTKITYPTGGFTSFELECNKVFSELDYYVNEAQSNTLEWYEDDFGDEYAISFSGRTDTLVQFLFRAEEFEERPEPEDPDPCFEESQDMKITRFEIRATDNSFSTYVEGYYSDFLGSGITRVISLPLNKSYLVKFIYNIETGCDFLYPFKTEVNAIYYTALQDKPAGGVRIKKIIFDDGTGTVLTKEYEYNDTTGHSSASLSSVPDFNYYRTGITHDVSGNYVLQRMINRSGNPTNTLSFHNGSPVIYTRVIEKESNGSITERQFDPFISDNTDGLSGYPFSSMQYFANLSGLPTKVIIKDSAGNVKKLQWSKYTKYTDQMMSDPDNRNLKIGTISTSNGYTANYFAVDQDYMYISRAEKIADTTITYENGQSLLESQVYTYHPSKYYLSTTTTIDSKNGEKRKSLSYAFDQSGSVYTKMITDNMLNYPAIDSSYIPGMVSGSLTIKKLNYSLWNSNVLPMPSSGQSAILGNTLETEVTFNDYDDKGNILQYTAKDGVINSFIWGYKKQYPVAKIVGKSHGDAVSQSSIDMNVVNAPSSESAMKTELAKLRTLSGCFVTTLTYTPLVGMISQTDPNGNTSYYEYDNFNRLYLIRDKDSNVVKKICYNYHGQPASCDYGTLAGWQVISSVCDTTGGGGGYNGNLIVTEKDMNPSSGTYGTTRTTTIADARACISCVGEDKKIINGVCETGEKVCTGDFRPPGQPWQHYYHYVWSDSSISDTYIGVGHGCLEL